MLFVLVWSVPVRLPSAASCHTSDVLSNVDPSWYFRKPGGGPLYDMTVYSLHGLTGVLGPAKRVTAMSAF
ncbi:MAG: hypothetical protein Fur005_47890 [Roseiflexaceae bacterium]